MAEETKVKDAPQEEVQELNEDQLLEQSIIQEKEREIIQLKEANLKLEKEVVSMTNRSLKVHEKNTLLMSSEEITQKLAMLEYEQKVLDMQLARAERFAKSKAFPSNTPEQCFVLMKAGEEMGVSEIVALNMLYVVNGHINPYGDKMLGYIRGHGYDVEYLDEDIRHLDKNFESTVTVRIFNENESYQETVKSTDQIIMKSLQTNAQGKGGAASFALKNKMRFHGIRMIISFYLAHLFMGCGDAFSPDFDKWSQDEQVKLKDKDGKTILVVDEDLKRQIDNAKDEDELDELLKIKKVSKSTVLTMAVGARRKFLQSQKD